MCPWKGTVFGERLADRLKVQSPLSYQGYIISVLLRFTFSLLDQRRYTQTIGKRNREEKKNKSWQ